MSGNLNKPKFVITDDFNHNDTQASLNDDTNGQLYEFDAEEERQRHSKIQDIINWLHQRHHDNWFRPRKSRNSRTVQRWQSTLTGGGAVFEAAYLISLTLSYWVP